MHCLRCRKPLTPSQGCYGMHPECFADWFEVPQTARLSDLARLSSELDSNIGTSKNSSFFQGTFRKYSAILGGRSFILKMRQAEAPELPNVEYLCNQIGSALEIPVAQFYMIHFEGEWVFVTENFIHDTVPMDLQHFSHFRDPTQHNCKDLIALIAEHSRHPRDIKTFIHTILFDALIGNHDRHGKNLAFLVTAHKIELSPIYDNVSYLSLESGPMLRADFNPTGRVATALSHAPSMQDYVLEFKTLGFLEEVLQFYRNIDLDRIEDLIDQSFCSTLMKDAFKKLIQKRYQELKHGLAS